jgi:hypothetical protein
MILELQIIKIIENQKLEFSYLPCAIESNSNEMILTAIEDLKKIQNYF